MQGHGSVIIISINSTLINGIPEIINHVVCHPGRIRNSAGIVFHLAINCISPGIKHVCVNVSSITVITIVAISSIIPEI
jgi:hypothetical protein